MSIEAARPIIGMVHLLPLPGCAIGQGDLEAAIARAVQDAAALEAGGVDGIIVENFFDAPFHKERVDAVTVAAMTRAVLAVRQVVGLPIGINVLRNDVEAAISIAHVCGAEFVRCNVYVGAVVTDQGIIEGAARSAVALRSALGADVEIWADVNVKHSAPLTSEYGVPDQARDAIERGLADRLIVTGAATGAATPLELVELARKGAPHTPILIGSGVSASNVEAALATADGAIVGSSFKSGEDIRGPIDVGLVRRLVGAANRDR